MKLKTVSYLAVLAVGIESAPSVLALELEEVIVTADRREESLQDVSLSVSALTGDQLSELGLQDASELAAYIPGLELRENGLFPGYFIRGAGVQTETNDINEQPVSVYIDEVYLGFPTAQRGQIFDLERAEVLRGPQGTMFGRNAPGGVVQFISRKPQDEFDGYLEAQLGNFDQRILEGAVNLPISDAVRTRASVKYNKDDGWQEDRFTGERFSDNDILSGRLQMDIDISEKASLLLKADGMRQRNAGIRYAFSGLLDPETFSPCSLSRVNAQECVAVNGYRDPELDPGRVGTDTEGVDDIDDWGVSATFQMAISDTMTLTSITAYRELEREWAIDGDASPVLIFGLFNFDTFRATDANQFSQELRLNGTTDALNWVAGVYYYEDSRFVENTFAAFGRSDFTDLDTESWAVFGQVDYAMSEEITLIAGLRYTDEEKSALKYRNTPDVTFTPVLDDTVTTGRLGVEWRPLDDTMFYANYSTGFKSGTFAAGANDDVVDPETATSYEIGVKSEFWGGRARVNATVYYNEYDDFQATGTVVDDGIPSNELVNVGALEVAGLESDISLVLSESLDVNLGINLTDGEISAPADQASGAFDYETGEPFFFDGKRPAQLPDYTLNATVSYRLPVSPSRGSFRLQLSGRYSGDMFLDAVNNRLHYQEAFGTLAARLLWNSADDRWYANAFVNNITDEKVRSYSFDISGFVDNRSIAWGQRPLSGGVKVGYRFGS